jgi:hypothetical protein
MRRIGKQAGTRHPIWVVLAFACIALIFFSGLVQVAHTHAPGPLPHSDCTFCLTAHLSIHPGAVPPDLQPILAPVWRVADPKPVQRYLSFAFSLYSRPPPDQTAVA